jgi:hypothetical protein
MEKKDSIRILQIMFGAFVMAQVAFLVVVRFINSGKAPTPTALNEYLPLLVIALLLLGYFLFRRKIFAILSQPTMPIAEKMEAYRAASLLKWACFEGGALLALVVYFISGDLNLWYLAAAAILHFLIHFPSAARVAREIGE